MDRLQQLDAINFDYKGLETQLLNLTEAEFSMFLRILLQLKK